MVLAIAVPALLAAFWLNRGRWWWAPAATSAAIAVLGVVGVAAWPHQPGWERLSDAFTFLQALIVLCFSWILWLVQLIVRASSQRRERAGATPKLPQARVIPQQR